MRVYAFVPAKGTSDRVTNKNMRFLDGERLYIRALKTLLSCKEIDQVFLDTDSSRLYELVDYLPITFMKRDRCLATNKTDGHQLFLNEIRSYPQADIYVQMLCTSPFIRSETIDRAIQTLKSNNTYDSAILMKRDKYYFWNRNKPSYNQEHIPNSVDLPDTISESMGLYIHKKDSALKTKRRYGENPLFIFGSAEELIDVNTPDDLKFAECYAKGIRCQENARLNLMKHFVTSAALSDLLDDMHVEKKQACGAVVAGWRVNLPNIKVLGRANTLKLRALRPDEDYNGIYQALKSYEGLTENNVICVENELKEYAYFGDLNARLALRSGASATIIDGMTRDLSETKQLNYPVIARGYNAIDVRRRATVDYINKPIRIGGYLITPGDLIFVDAYAMVVIYQKYEKEVIERVLKTFESERAIITDILTHKSIHDITENHGSF